MAFRLIIKRVVTHHQNPANSFITDISILAKFSMIFNVNFKMFLILREIKTIL